MNGKKILKLVSIPLSLLFWIAVWAFISLKVNNEFLLPGPSDTLHALNSLVSDSEFWLITAASLSRILFGITIAAVLGSLLGIITAKLGALDSLFSPVMTLVKATPIASFIVLALLWADRNTLPIFITILIVLPIIHSNVSGGIRSVSKELLEVAKIYRLGFWKKLTKIYLPSVIPFFLAACRASLGMAWKAGIAAEVLCTPKNAIGTQIYFSKTYLETPALFAWTLVIIILSVIIEKLLLLVLSSVTKTVRAARKEAEDAEA